MKPTLSTLRGLSSYAKASYYLIAGTSYIYHNTMKYCKCFNIMSNVSSTELQYLKFPKMCVVCGWGFVKDYIVATST